MKNRLLAGIILIFAIALCLAGCKTDPEPEPIIVYTNSSVNADYHITLDCVIITLSPGKEFVAITREAAINYGFHPCRTCKAQ